MTGKVIEIFDSIQGEGLYVGTYQTFLRLEGCNLRCRYCDTAASYAGGRKMTAEETAERCLALPPKIVSVTGGEPLCQPDFLREVCKLLKDGGKDIHLETNGTLPKELEQVIDLVDVVAMDFKLPSSSGCGELWDVHKKFLRIASRKEVFVKVVCGENTPMEELLRCKEIAGDTSLVIQPVFGEKPNFSRIALLLRDNFRIIPQCHKILEVP